MTEYAYYYDASGAAERTVANLRQGAARPYAEEWEYDAETRRVIARNVERSLLLDAKRARLAPTTEKLRERVVAEHEQGHR